MLYLVAFLFPPLAVLLCGKPFQAVLNLFLTLLLYVPGLVHALIVVANRDADRRTDRLVRALAAPSRAVARSAPPAPPPVIRNENPFADLDG